MGGGEAETESLILLEGKGEAETESLILWPVVCKLSAGGWWWSEA